MSAMDQILEINGTYYLTINLNYSRTSFSTEADGDLRCQAGAQWEDINRVLKEKGIPLFFPVSLFRTSDQQRLTSFT